MDEQHQIKFKYVFPENYNPVYCNGTFGGVSTSGEIVANFFLERMPIPNTMINSVNEDGSLGDVVKVDPEDLNGTVIRYVSAGIILSEAGAKTIYEWLGNQIKELENRRSILNAFSAERE